MPRHADTIYKGEHSKYRKGAETAGFVPLRPLRIFHHVSVIYSCGVADAPP